MELTEKVLIQFLLREKRSGAPNASDDPIRMEAHTVEAAPCIAKALMIEGRPRRPFGQSMARREQPAANSVAVSTLEAASRGPLRNICGLPTALSATSAQSRKHLAAN